MAKAIIGFTGFVGSQLCKDYCFDFFYNSSNIGHIADRSFDLLVIAAPSAVKWQANKNPEIDWAAISSLQDLLKTVKAEKTILISTTDVYKSPVIEVDELISPSASVNSEAYGRHRRLFELFVSSHFEDHSIFRLPALFGTGLKKNYIFDLIHSNNRDQIVLDSAFQWYSTQNLWEDILKYQKYKIVNLSTEPLTTREIVETLFPESVKACDNISLGKKYDMRSVYSPNGYFYGKKDTLDLLREFVNEELISKQPLLAGRDRSI